MDIWDSVKGAVSSIAPVLANAIIPGSGGVATSIIASVLGCEDTADSIESAIASATPEQKEALISEQNRHSERLIELGLENTKLEMKDMANARARDRAMIKAGKHNWRADIMILVAFSSFCFIAFMIWQKPDIPGSVLTIFNMSIGSLLTMLNSSFQFEFGSSKGSKEKDLK